MASRATPRQAVNSEPSRELTSQVSPQGLAILQALAASRGRKDWRRVRPYAPGELPTSDLVKLLTRPRVAKGVLKASLSRTLRRLWRAGLVELQAATWQKTMTEQQRERVQKVQQLEADPVAAYQDYRRVVASLRLPDKHGSPAAYLAAMRVRTERPPDVRVTTVSITKAGRALVNSVGSRQVNR